MTNQKLTIEEMQKLASKRHGECLSLTYINNHTKLKWRCSKKHIWKARPHDIKNGSWCPDCSKVRKYTIKQMNEIAKLKEGKCLSNEYTNSHTKLSWKCKNNHQWWTNPYSIIQGKWCPQCAKVKKLTIKEMQELAQLKEGKCMSEKYINSNSNLKWQCKEGHIWEAKPSIIKSGCWCPKCGKVNMVKNNHGKTAMSTITKMQELAKSKGGKCLSKEYINNYTNLRWKCKEGHTWNNTPAHIKLGIWCHICHMKNGGNKKKITIKDMQKLAELRFGKCLSNKYAGYEEKLNWECKYKHKWQTTPHAIKNKRWCPECSYYRSEKLCREYLEKKTKLKFPKCKPKWLNGLELDGYCKKLNLAFEYNGLQHYEYIALFHKKKQDFLNQQKRDKIKSDLCKSNHIKLIIIPSKYNSYNPNKMYKFIDSQII